MRFISVGLILSVLLLAPVLPAKPHGLKVSHHPEFFGDHHTTQATSNGGMKGGKKDGWTLPMTRRLQEDFLWEPYLVYDYLDSSSTGRGLSMTVLWRSSQGCGICLDESSCFVSLQGSTEISGHQKHTFSDLNFNVTYGYSVTCGSTTLEGTFKTPEHLNLQGLPTVTKMFAYGDSRDDPAMHNTIMDHMLNDDSDWKQAMALHTGDYGTHGRCLDEWDDDLMLMDGSVPSLREFMRNSPINGVRGNHENSGDCWWIFCSCPSSSYSTLFDDVFPHPNVGHALSYSFDYGNAHVVAIDQYDESGDYDTSDQAYGYCSDEATCTPCSDHYMWIKNDIEAAKARNPRPFLLAVVHEPLLSAGGGHSNRIEPCLEKLLEDQGVNIILLAGHNHYYARAEKVTPSGKTVYHITTGAGSTCCYQPDPPVDLPDAVKVVFSVNHYCRMDAHIIPNPSSRYLCFEAVDYTGSVIDHFEINPDERPANYQHCKCVSDADCDDGLFCNGVETCDLTSGCLPGTPPDCDDGVACTVDFCNEDTDSCDDVPDDALCDNGVFCDGSETCDDVLGCQPGTPPDCDDGVACTEDSCNIGTDSCDNVPNDALCDVGLVCDETYGGCFGDCGGFKASCREGTECCSGICRSNGRCSKP